MSKRFPWCRTVKTYFIYDYVLRKVIESRCRKKDAEKAARRLTNCVVVEMRGTYIVPRTSK